MATVARAEHMASIGPHGKIALDPRVDGSVTDASCEFCAHLSNSVRRVVASSTSSSSSNSSSGSTSACSPNVGHVHHVDGCRVCFSAVDATSRGSPWARARNAGGFLGENIQSHLLRLKAKSKALQLFPKKEQNELHRSDSFKFQKYERDRDVPRSPKIIVDDEYALPVDLIVRYSEENGKRQIYLPAFGPHHELNNGPVGLLGNYCDPLDCKSYVDPGEEEKIYLCDDSLRAGDCSYGCDGTYIQPETCQAPCQGGRTVDKGEVRENSVRIEVPPPVANRNGQFSSEFERRHRIRLSPVSAQVFHRRLQARVADNCSGKVRQGGSQTTSQANRGDPGVAPVYENVTWVAVTPPTSVNESTDDDDQLSCEEGEFIIDLPCCCACCQPPVAVQDVARHRANGSGHPLHRSHSALVLSVPTHGVCCSAVPDENVGNCWCSKGNASQVVPKGGNLVSKPPLPHGSAARSSGNMCFRQAVDPEDDVDCVFRVPVQNQGSSGNNGPVSEQPAGNFTCSPSQGSSQQQGKDGQQRKASKPGIRSLLLRQSQPKRLFLSPAKPGRIYCPNDDANRNRHYFPGIVIPQPHVNNELKTQQDGNGSQGRSPTQNGSSGNSPGPMASPTPLKSCNQSPSCHSKHRCDSSASDHKPKCDLRNGFSRSASFNSAGQVVNGDIVQVKLEFDVSQNNECSHSGSPRQLQQTYLASEASSSESSSQISSLESVRSSASSVGNHVGHLSGSYSTYLCQRVSTNGGSPLPATTEVHVDFKPPTLLSIPVTKRNPDQPSTSCANNAHKRNTWVSPAANVCFTYGDADVGLNIDDLADLPFEMPKLQRKLEQLKRHSWNEGDALLAAPHQQYVSHVPAIGEPDGDVNLSTSDLEGSVPSDSASPVRPRRRSDLHLKLSSNLELPHIDVELPLQRQGWYHGAISRKDAENLLRMTKEGSFLVRNSESSQKGFSLSLKSPRGFMHMRISEQNKGEYVLGEFSKPFNNIPAMVYHYVRNRLPIKGAEHMSLRFPIIEQLL